MTKGTDAWNRVKNKVTNLGALTVLINNAKPGGKVSSCNLTANILGQLLDPAWFVTSDMTPVHMVVQAKTTATATSSTGFGAMMDGMKGLNKLAEPVALRQEVRVQKVRELLDTLSIVYIAVIPDHHFVVFPISDTEVVILQGFEDVYTLVDWMNNAYKGGVFQRAKFMEALDALISDDGNKRRAAAAALFGYDEPAIIAQIVDYFKIPTTISAIAHKSL